MMMTDLEEAGWRKIQPKKVFLEEEKNSIFKEAVAELKSIGKLLLAECKLLIRL